MATKQRKLRYKRATFVGAPSGRLQSLVERALAAVPTVEERELDSALEGTRTVITGVSNTNGMLVAKLMLYTPGQKQKFFELSESGQDYELASMALPAGEAIRRREFVESLLYLAIFEDHVCFIGSSALRAANLETYLNWLLRVTGQLEIEQFVVLADQQSAKAAASLRRNPVREILIGGELEFEEVSRVPTQRRTHDREGVPGHKVVKPAGALADALTALFGPIFADTSLQSALKHQERVDFKMSFSYRNRKKTREGYDLMENLAIAGRNFDENQCVIRLENGGEIRDGDLKLFTLLTVDVTADGRIEEPDIWLKVHSWLGTSIAGGAVAP